ncbi:hypothetical protein [Lacticaseibacillus songhuajiangensis]|jgi:ABC-type multidrug transport system fused ATPase/permease subunit|uniref:hypothetical protein n=1 Tax=Lacticaseibacillus songhuajiangensis TaxID=1296539 RepID=UPI000F7911A3|nr:hypothetical protein [Lacticaseibacillus songhuajiangensis]
MSEQLIHFQYCNVNVKQRYKWLYLDYYPCFGWEWLETVPAKAGQSYTQLTFRRKYTLQRHTDLQRAQNKFDSCMDEIDNLETSTGFAATTSALVLGIIGIFFIIGTILMMIKGWDSAMLLLIPGSVAFLAAYPVYLIVKRNKEKQIVPFVSKRMDRLYEISLSAEKLNN